MSEQERESNRQSDSLNLDDRDCKNNKVAALHAFEKLRSLNDKEHPLSLKEVIAESYRLNEIYKRWQQSNAAINDINVRISNGEKITLSQNNNTRQCSLRLNDNLPHDSVLHIWKEADEQFEEVLLLSLLLSRIPPDGVCFDRKYSNGQTLSLRAEHCLDGEISISVELIEPATEEARNASRADNITPLLGFLRNAHWARQMKLAYALALAVLIMNAMAINFIWRKNGLSALTDSGVARQSLEREIANLNSSPELRQIEDAPEDSSESPTPDTRTGKETIKRHLPAQNITTKQPHTVPLTTVTLESNVFLRGEATPYKLSRINISGSYIQFRFILPEHSPPGSYNVSFLNHYGDDSLFMIKDKNSDGKTLRIIIPTRAIPNGSFYITLSYGDDAPVYYLVEVIR
jgi:hypothetical protein